LFSRSLNYVRKKDLQETEEGLEERTSHLGLQTFGKT
jgi:hypothetical protein